MPSEEPQDVDTRRRVVKRKRETPASRAARSNKATPNAYARRSPPRDPEPLDDDEDADRSPPRKLKRPGAGARIAAGNREAAERERRQREEEARRGVQGRAINAAELVAEHYNAVPERGREWRSTESKIKGLRSLNNWIKSTLIQKFSRPEIPVSDMKVIDLACGKGGDLGKWEKAPQIPVLYVGCDIANVSIEQAQQRHNNPRGGQNGRGRRPRMQAEFFVHDTFAHSLIDIPIVRSIGFNPNVGPGGIIQGGMASGGFDVVSMMFALHYSFETEELARGMLRNVSGALKKGGRFIGVMPNSDVITTKVKGLLVSEKSSGKTPNGTSTPAAQNGDHSSAAPAEVDDWDPEKPADASDDDWDPEKPSDPQALANGDADEDDWDPEKPSEPAPASTAAQSAPEPTSQANANQHSPVDVTAPPLTWGNSIYSVKFPRQQPLTNKPLPKDGIFRPPFGWKYHYSLEEAVDAAEYVVPWEAFRALAEDYGLELMYRKGFREVFEDESEDRELGQLAERMGVLSRDRSMPNGGLLVNPEEMDAASFYHAFCFYKT
ncbi:putative mRNA (guanine-N(7))-methyltransferase domain, mRNA cap guanine-N7 methyltransferase [Septoria linicola]|nr:putative mRNA (guanine-N(7))-methyltransferase domain, mRNA cap guanine-N7 methyltransferase [Septoria linicola]